LSEKPPVPAGGSLDTWATRIYSYLIRTRSKLADLLTGDSAAEDGIIMWDRENKYPVVSKDGAWTQIVLEDGHANFTRSTDVTAAAADTAYAVQYDSPTNAVGISLDGTDPTKIVFAEAGEYTISFTAQISSGTSSSIDFYFWPRVNGIDVTGSTMLNSIKQNSTILVVARTAIFELNAGDYLQVMWATNDTNGKLDATAATAFAPAAPSTTLAITRIHG
jgi:hypothetical protein